MKVNFAGRIVCLIYTVLLLPDNILAQSIIEQVSTSENVQYVQRKIQVARAIRSYEFATAAEDPDTLVFSLEAPFFDDFSQIGTRPDSNKWWLTSGSLAFPLKSEHIALQPPSYGVLTFDGLNALGLPYSTQILEQGITDELRSHFIDLAAFGPEDNIVLSFFLQPQGIGNAPEVEDSFKVSFTLMGQAIDSLQDVLSIAGRDLSPFQQYLIPLDDPMYFHSQFQIVFQSFGSRNGQLDLWHLDYVYLGANRTLTDSTYNDISIVDAKLDFFEPYTAYPAVIYPPDDIEDPLIILNVGNLDVTQRSFTVDGNLEEFPGRSIEFENSVQLDPLSTGNLSVRLNDGLRKLDTPNGKLILKADILEQDEIISNNSFIRSFPLDSVLAYDDGEADASYGITQPKGFGVRYTLPASDTYELRAVWMSFVPLFNPSQVGNVINYMDGKGFRLMVWKAPDPDSFIVNQIGTTRVIYGDSLNHFHRFVLDQPVLLPDTFWVGIQQTDGLPIGVGYDLTVPKFFTYWDSLGVWTLSNIGGTPMIRPEIHISSPVTLIQQPLSVEHFDFVVFPQPSIDERIHVRWAPKLKDVSLTLYDMQARVVTTQQFGVSYVREADLNLHSIPKGMYWIEVTGTDRAGRTITGSSRLIK